MPSRTMLTPYLSLVAYLVLVFSSVFPSSSTAAQSMPDMRGLHTDSTDRWYTSASGPVLSNQNTPAKSQIPMADLGPGLLANISAVAVGYGNACVLTNSGGVKCWGFNFEGQVGDGTTDTRLAPVE